MLLGYPFSGNLSLVSEFDNYVNYYGAFVQDDWRVSDKLTVNYGVRLEHETGLAERRTQLVVGFDRNVASPLNVVIPADPVAGRRARQVLGRLLFAGQMARPNTSVIAEGEGLTSSRHGVQLQPDNRCCVPATASSGRHGSRACRRPPVIRSATTFSKTHFGRLRPSTTRSPWTDADFRQRAWPAYRRERRCDLYRSRSRCATRASILGGPSATAARRHEHRLHLHGSQRPTLDLGVGPRTVTSISTRSIRGSYRSTTPVERTGSPSWSRTHFSEWLMQARLPRGRRFSGTSCCGRSRSLATST